MWLTSQFGREFRSFQGGEGQAELSRASPERREAGGCAKPGHEIFGALTGETTS